MPLDLLDRILIIKLMPYNAEDMAKILKIRADTEQIPVAPDALLKMAEIGSTTTLRYAPPPPTHHPQYRRHHPSRTHAHTPARTHICKYIAHIQMLTPVWVLSQINVVCTVISVLALLTMFEQMTTLV
jgi:hypothetical protein